MSKTCAQAVTKSGDLFVKDHPQSFHQTSLFEYWLALLTKLSNQFAFPSLSFSQPSTQPKPWLFQRWLFYLSTSPQSLLLLSLFIYKKGTNI